MRYHYFAKFPTLFIVEFGLKISRPSAQLEAIRICLDGETNLKEWTLKSLQTAKEDEAYNLLNKKFWLEWSAFVGLKEKDPYGLTKRTSSHEESKKARRPAGLVNERLRASTTSNYLKPTLVYGKDYVIVPPRVWKAFVNWYGRSYEIVRKVIISPKRDFHLRSTVL